ncbi:zeta toxin family protein [Chitinophaga rhizophila]|uniref:Zeta toxin family protein n=1 Tax=Chitinophaga rhizophila TaxID=2866212 RepID=A0ABS7GCN0_9BACT|nr:zeta toxin family protein [Chitinophaga rhizophila]MBW8685428.1 zeta toxin family protein [Chitinophaga rhizophila]
MHSQTLSHTRFRDRNFKEESQRWVLRKQIIKELLTLTRPDDDDTICLGHGGALPQSGIKADSQAYILIGLPASGKSTIASVIAERYGAVTIDADFAKRKLPEYANYTWGATIVHEESSRIATGFIENPRRLLSVYEAALEMNYNVVIPKIGQHADAILGMGNTLKAAGYTVHLTLVSLFRREATIRALHRFNETGRYVPLGLIFDGYSNDPCLSYYMLKNMKQHIISSFGVISTDVPKGEPYKTIDLKGNNPAILYQIQQQNIKPLIL